MNIKQICAAMTAGTLLYTSMPASAAGIAPNAIVYGDVDGSGTADIADVALLQQFLTRPHAAIPQNADLTGDGKINVLDLALLKQSMGSSAADDFSGLVINEICASNKTCWSDADGREPDWAELYNGTEMDLDISGCGFSDSEKDLFQYVFPAGTIIPAHGYLMICCDDAMTSTDASEHHAPFKLSASGETVYLTHPIIGALDVVTIPATATDITYGRFANGSDNFSHLTPTPNASNDTAQKVSLVAAPLFSVESGFYDAQFQLDITSSEGCSILYTTDGTDPITSDTASAYDGSIRIYDNTYEPNKHVGYDITLYDDSDPSFSVDKGHIIRAVCVDANGNYSDVVTKSYYVGKTASYYKDMKVVSLVTDPDNLFDGDKGIYVVGNAYYNWKNSSDYNPSYEEWDVRNPTNYNQSGITWERPVDVQVFENGTLAYENSVGMRIAGNATRSNAQKSIRLYARSAYGSSKMKYAFFDALTDENGKIIKEFDKVTLRNHGNDVSDAQMRDDIVQQLARNAGMKLATQASEGCVVFLDGEFWGCYALSERLEDDYVQAHYGIDKKNVTTIKTYEIEGDAAIGQSYIDFYKWAMSADMSKPENYARVCDTIDMQSFMDYITIETYVCNWDWCNASGTNNWQLWRSNTTDSTNAYADGKWRYMLFDTEYSSGLYGGVQTSHAYDVFENMNRKQEWGNIGALFYKLLENTEFKTAFEENYRYHVENNFDYETKIAPIINAYATERKDASCMTFQRFQGEWGQVLASKYDESIQVVHTFYQNRARYALQYLDKVLGNDVPDIPSDGNMLSDRTLWNLYIDSSGGNGSISVDENGNLTVKTTGISSVQWGVQANYTPVTLEAGKTYRFSYTLRSDVNGSVAAFLQRNADPYDTFTWERRYTGTTPQTYTQTFTAKESCSIIKAGFDCGYNVGTFYISDIALELVE